MLWDEFPGSQPERFFDRRVVRQLCQGSLLVLFILKIKQVYRNYTKCPRTLSVGYPQINWILYDSKPARSLDESEIERSDELKHELPI